MASAIELKSPNGAETIRLEHTSDYSKTIDAYKLIQLGDHGLGTGALGIINNDFNQSSTNCSFIKNNNAIAALNYPAISGLTNTTPFVGVNINHANDWGLQILGNVSGGNGPRLALRNKVSAVFSPWREIYTQQSLLGTVSQSSGIPTGAVIERGSNANGEYVRFADGTQICTTNSISISMATVTTADFDSTWAASFTTFPNVSANIQEVISGGARASLELRQVYGNATQFRATAYNAYGSAITATVRGIAIGRWF